MIALYYRYGGFPVDYNVEYVPPGYGSSWINYMTCPLEASNITDCKVEWRDSRITSVAIASGAVTCITQPAEGMAAVFISIFKFLETLLLILSSYIHS